MKKFLIIGLLALGLVTSASAVNCNASNTGQGNATSELTGECTNGSEDTSTTDTNNGGSTNDDTNSNGDEEGTETEGMDSKGGSSEYVRASDNVLMYDRIMSITSALSSVELNPDHEGLSLSVGMARSGGITTGALGLMYAYTVDETNIGWNLKSYTTQDGYRGFSGGVTIGF